MGKKKSEKKTSFFADVLRYFVPAFLLFFVIGGIDGFKRRPNIVRKRLYAELRVGDKDARYFLEHVCPDGKTVRFWVDTDQPELGGDPFNRFDSVKTPFRKPPSKRHLEYLSVMGGLVGGTTGGFSLQQLLKKPTAKTTWASHAKKTILGILGAISGYTAGRTVASQWDTECDSDLALETLRDTGFWNRVEGARLSLYLMETIFREGALIAGSRGKNQNPWFDDPLFLCDNSIAETARDLLRALEPPEPLNPDSQFFRDAERIGKVAAELRRTPEYKRLLRLHKGRILSEIRRKNLPQALINRYGYTPEAWEEACSEIRVRLREQDG